MTNDSAGPVRADSQYEQRKLDQTHPHSTSDPAASQEPDVAEAQPRWPLQAWQKREQERMSRTAQAHAASISAMLEDLSAKLPHVHLPRFPPAVRRLRAVLQGESDPNEACKQGLVKRKRPDRNTLATRDVRIEPDIIALESTGGRKRVYKWRQGRHPDGSFEMVQEHESGKLALQRLWASFLVPSGYPDSVSPQYKEYMFWRGVQYFFGGALSLFTTRALLTSVGVKRGASTSAAAINWVVKDGAGRMGRFLFARWGHQLDCELKQFRLLGDGLMEAGAVLELSTVAMPRQFLLLACTANMMKNLAAVAASSTRAPIYRTFALRNNMADVTAKGESVANLSDVLGVAAGIALSKLKWPMAVTFGLLSCGYLLASRKEVDSVVLPYLNQARLAYAMDRFLAEGRVPGVLEGNKREPLLPLGPRWSGYGQVVVGASLEAACETPAHLSAAIAAFPHTSPYVLTYRPDKDKVFVVLRDSADRDAALEGAFAAHLWLDEIHERVAPAQRNCMTALPAESDVQRQSSGASVEVHVPGHDALGFVREHQAAMWTLFAEQAHEQGWKLQGTMLAVGDTRLLSMP